MTTSDYLDLKAAIIGLGYSAEIDWAARVAACTDAHTFACEACWVVLNAGLREQVARGVWNRLRPALEKGQSLDGLFGHFLKMRAIKDIWGSQDRLFDEYIAAADKLAFLETLPHIGPITKYHLGRNLGLDVCKPDRHLVRIAAPETPAVLCERLSDDTGDRIGLVDCVIWRAANLGLV